jgi:hypothetical protein
MLVDFIIGKFFISCNGVEGCVEMARNENCAKTRIRVTPMARGDLSVQVVMTEEVILP